MPKPCDSSTENFLKICKVFLRSRSARSARREQKNFANFQKIFERAQKFVLTIVCFLRADNENRQLFTQKCRRDKLQPNFLSCDSPINKYVKNVTNLVNTCSEYTFLRKHVQMNFSNSFCKSVDIFTS